MNAAEEFAQAVTAGRVVIVVPKGDGLVIWHAPPNERFPAPFSWRWEVRVQFMIGLAQEMRRDRG